MSHQDEQVLIAIERAMVTIRRRQTRRALSRLGRERHGITVDPTIMGILEAIEEAGRPCTIGEVAEAIGAGQPRASRLVARAVEEGLLVRLADRSDGRRTPLALTARGRDQLARMHRFRREAFARAMADWPEEDRAAFARLITSFVDAVRPVTGPPPG